MLNVNFKIIAILILIAGWSSAWAEKISLLGYLKDSVKTGTSVCELLDAKTGQSRCYMVIDWQTKLTQENDPSGRLKKGAMSPGQGQFTEVYIAELISTVTPGQKVSTIDIYVKLAWKGERAGSLNMKLNGQYVVRGQMKLENNGQFQFELNSIPDLILLGGFNPKLELAEIFGRNASKQTYELEHDVKSWTQDVLNSVLPMVYNQVKIGPKN